MNQTRRSLSTIWDHFQGQLFPWLQEELGPLSKKQQHLVAVLDLAQVEAHLPYIGRGPGRPEHSRGSIAHAFVAKAVYNLTTTEALLDYLKSSKTLRRLCGWEKRQDMPSASTFSRAFAEFSASQLVERIHDCIVQTHMGEQLCCHVSRDSTTIVAREKPVKSITKTKKPAKRGRPKKGETRSKEPTRLEKQLAGMSMEEMIEDLPTACDVGTKRNSKGYKTSWTDYKLHIDAVDGGVPVSCILTSASVHDSQVAMPLAEMTYQRVTSCYDLMDAAYDASQIKQHSQSLGHVPLIDENPRTSARKAEIKEELKGRRVAGYQLAEAKRYNERSTVERVNGRLKDEFNGNMVRARGHAKVMTHLMFGIIALTVDQLMRWIE